MYEKRVYDKSGNVLTLLDIDGTWYPQTCNPETVMNIPNIPLRNDDLFRCGFPRSGHHWVYEILNMLLSGTSEYVRHNIERGVLELEPNSTLEGLPSPRILTTHVLPHRLPTDHCKKGVKTVYIIRDPRDVAVSWFHFHQAYPGDPYDGDWDDWLDLFTRDKSCAYDCRNTKINLQTGLAGPFANRYSCYDSRKRRKMILEVKDGGRLNYEIGLYTHPMQETKRLVSFLDEPFSDDILMEIINKCTFENMKPEKARIDQEWKGKAKEAQYRKGIVGDWKNKFTREQEEKFNEMYKKKMEGSALKYRYDAMH